MKPAISHNKNRASGEMADTPVLGTGLERGESSSLSSPTKSVYDYVYNLDTLSTISRKKGSVERKCDSLRNQYGNM